MRQDTIKSKGRSQTQHFRSNRFQIFQSGLSERPGLANGFHHAHAEAEAVSRRIILRTLKRVAASGNLSEKTQVERTDRHR